MSGADLSQQLQEYGQQLARMERQLTVLINEKQPITFSTLKGQRGGKEQ